MPLQLKIKKFVIYYDKHPTAIGSIIKHWQDAIIEGVQCVALFYEDGKPEIFRGKDLYMMYVGRHGMTFAMVDRPSPMIELCEKNEIKIGRLIGSHDHNEIMKKAQGDTYGS